MITENTIYCVGCSSIVAKEKAKQIFRTGYYKVSMNLGICCACEEKNKEFSLQEPTDNPNPSIQEGILSRP